MVDDAFPEEQAAAAVYVGLEVRTGLEKALLEVGGSIRSGELARWIQRPGGARDAEIAAAMHRDLSLYRTYRALLQTLRRRHIPVARAADDGVRKQRSANGVQLSWQPSKADAGQVYLIVQFEASAGISDGEELTLVVDPGDKPPLQRRRLEPISGGGCQLILRADDPLLAALQDDDAEIYIV